MCVRALLSLTVFIVSAHQTLLGESSGDWTYSVSDSEATITGYSGNGGAVEIPGVVNGISVVKVGGGLFPISGSGNTTVTSITIPDSVTSINSYAFYSYTSLASITIPDSVTSIGPAAFRGCASLTSITIPDSVTFIGLQAFESCTSLTSISIPDSVTYIGSEAFFGCTSLASVTLPILFKDSYSSFSLSSDQVLLYGVGTSGDWTYSVLDSQGTITGYSGGGGAVEIPGVVDGISVVKVGDGFPSIFGNGNTSVTSVTIGDSVTSIGDYAFSYCTSLTSVTIGDSVTSIGNYAFYNCSSLTSVNIPDSVTSIGDYAFYECTSLASLTLPILFKDSYSSFSLSSDQVLLYGSPAARDVLLSNNLAAGRTLGRSDVTSDPSSYSLYTATELSAAAEAARTIVNVSARVALGEDEIVTPGFVVLGESKQLLIRAVGPKLADLGVPSPLPDPTMTIYRTRYDGQPNDVVAIIDDWKEQPEQANGADVAAINAAMASAGAFPLEPTETFQGRPFMTDDTSSAAALLTLDVGVYTVQVSSADEGVGEVLVEVYEITD